jgi:Tol biopolymer transport system component
MRRSYLLILTFCCLSGASVTQPETQSPYASKIPLPEPVVFAPGVISTGDYESHPAFTPDGTTLYYLKDTPDFSFWTIVVSHFKNGTWSTPEVAPFSGQYADADPFITSDGSKMYFISNRPVNGKSKEDLDIWMMEKSGDGWSEPKNLGEPVNSTGNEWYPTVASDRTLYFGSNRPGGKGRNDLYSSKFVDGKYLTPENLGDPINTKDDEYEPYIAPDQSYLIFMAGRPDGFGGFDLYISYKRDGKWTPAKNLGEKFSSEGFEYSPKLSPDGKYFFFTSTRGFGSQRLKKKLNYEELIQKLRGPGNGLGDIYQVDVSALRVGKSGN